METKVLLDYSKQPDACPYPETDRSSFLKIQFNIILLSTS